MSQNKDPAEHLLDELENLKQLLDKPLESNIPVLDSEPDDNDFLIDESLTNGDTTSLETPSEFSAKSYYSAPSNAADDSAPEEFVIDESSIDADDFSDIPLLNEQIPALPGDAEEEFLLDFDKGDVQDENILDALISNSMVSDSVASDGVKLETMEPPVLHNELDAGNVSPPQDSPFSDEQIEAIIDKLVAEQLPILEKRLRQKLLDALSFDI